MTPAPPTIAAALQRTYRSLDAAGIPEARREARLLLGHAIGAGPEFLIAHPARELTGEETARLDALAVRRRRREPMAHILGRREFWSLEFHVTADTLDPRPDSETLIEAVLAAIGDRSAGLDILDLGTGTGCLLLALLSEFPNASGVGIDISPPALAIAGGNAARLGFADRAAFRRGDWGRGIAGRFDVIVANPPYIRRGRIATLQPEIALFEPRLALDGGADGLDCFRAMADDVARLLAPQGIAAIEFGEDQGPEIKQIFSGSGLEIRDFRHDLRGHPRCLLAVPATELTVT